MMLSSIDHLARLQRDGRRLLRVSAPRNIGVGDAMGEVPSLLDPDNTRLNTGFNHRVRPEIPENDHVPAY